MKLQEYLEQDKDRLLASLSQAGSAERAIPLIESEYDRLLYRYNEDCTSDTERRCAAHMLQTARMAAPLVDCVGETKIWEKGGKLLTEEKKKVRLPAVILLVAGIALPLAAVAVLSGTDEALAGVMEMPAIGVTFGGGLLCLFLAGLFFTKRKNATYSEKELMAENRIDANKIYQTMHAVLLIVDRNIAEALSVQQLEERQRQESEGKEEDISALSLYADLLEAQYARDGEYALDQLSKVPFYLHQQGIEMLNYSEEDRSWFDVIPGEKKETIRPALVKDGKLLKKGIVSGDWS
ncbi:MAG: hypothetical protein IKE21_00855 [Erysipelotrichaceae bacterium]|nr:hypothetical protein [Erysipelotrichaceae bacterium]